MKNLRVNEKLFKKLLTIGGVVIVAGSLFPVVTFKDQTTSTVTNPEDSVIEDSVIMEDSFSPHLSQSGKVLLETIGLNSTPPVINVRRLVQKEPSDLESSIIDEKSCDLEVDPVYTEIANYVNQVTEEDVEAFHKEVLSFYEISSTNETFRFDPNNEKIMDQKIKAYAENMNSEENMTYWTSYQVNVFEEDPIVSKFMKDYQEEHPDMTEKELQEKNREFGEKASAMYYTKMNLRYLDTETLLLLNKKYCFVDSENIEEIKTFVCDVPINYEKTPLMKELVARNEDYLAHSLLNSDERYLDLIGWEELEQDENAKMADEVIQGVWGSGKERRENLAWLGYDYYKVQEIVNQKMWGKWKGTDIELISMKGDPLYRTPTLPTTGDALCRRAALESVVQHQLLEDAIDYNFDPRFRGPYFYDPQMMLIKAVIRRQFYEIGSMLWERENITDCNEIQRMVLEEMCNRCFDYCIDQFFEELEQVQQESGKQKCILEKEN